MTARQTLATANSTRATSPDFADTSPGAAEPTAPPKTGRSRKIGFTTLGLVVLAAGVGWGAYEWLVASHYESTDNAYVQGNVIQITPQIGGTVMAIMADDTDFVKAGQPLVQLDPADAKVALDQAEAALAQTVRQVRTLYANNGSLARRSRCAQADWPGADRLARATTTCNRRASAGRQRRRVEARNSTTRRSQLPTREQRDGRGAGRRGRRARAARQQPGA